MAIMPVDYAVADREFYAPLETATSDDDRFLPPDVPDGWRSVESGIWTNWFRPGLLTGVEEGWKVHVSARPDRLCHVLNTAAAVCFEQDVPFKHLTSRLFYWWTHHKYAPRQQSGKFIAAYPRDVEASRALMERLREALAGEDGPFILTDRRYRDSKTVHYRYGGYTPRFRISPEGTRSSLVRDGNGALIKDRRGPSFHLPAGVTDPFREPARGGAVKPSELSRFEIEKAVRHTNAGGAYLAREIATGLRVFIKEGRSHTGLRDDDATATEQLREEWETLTALHALAPGLAPEPITYFRIWEHEFLVTEFIDGDPLWKWLATDYPMLWSHSTPEDFARYYARCERILAAIERELDRLHALGYLFVDISAGNVLIADDDTVRLIDFGLAYKMGTPFKRGGTPGFAPPEKLVGDDNGIYDEYGLSALAQLLVGPLHLSVQRNNDVLTHLHYDLTEKAPVPATLWRRVTRFHPPSETPLLPDPEQVAADPIGHLSTLRDRIGDALIAMVDTTHPDRVFPTVPEGYQANSVWKSVV